MTKASHPGTALQWGGVAWPGRLPRALPGPAQPSSLLSDYLLSQLHQTPPPHMLQGSRCPVIPSVFRIIRFAWALGREPGPCHVC